MRVAIHEARKNGSIAEIFDGHIRKVLSDLRPKPNSNNRAAINDDRTVVDGIGCDRQDVFSCKYLHRHEFELLVLGPQRLCVAVSSQDRGHVGLSRRNAYSLYEPAFR